MHKSTKYITIFALAIALISLAIIITLKSEPKPKALVSAIDNKKTLPIGSDFILKNADGVLIDSKELRGKYMLIYFGFTFCPDICPASLIEMTHAIEELGKRANKLQAIFITIDPLRDNPEQLKSYFKEFDSRILPLTGTKAEIDIVANNFKVYYAIAPESIDDKENYMINHSSFFYFLGPDGKMIKYYGPGTKAEDMAKDMSLYID